MKLETYWKYCGKKGEIAPEEQFLLFSTIFFYQLIDFHVKAGTRFSLRDKRLFEISEFEITRVNCSSNIDCFDVPDSLSLKLAILTPVFKKKGSNLDSKNYRGTTVNPTVTKVLETVLRGRIKPLIQGQQNSLQRGFTEGSLPPPPPPPSPPPPSPQYE